MSMHIEKQTFFHVSQQLNWQKGKSYFIGKEDTIQYKNLMMQGFSIPKANGELIPLNRIVEGMEVFLTKKTKALSMPETYHFNPSNTLMEALPMIRSQLFLIRELIFEETRRDHFPNKTSRYKSIHVIPSNKEALSFWLPLLKKTGAKIYKLELTGKIHRGSSELLNINSIPPEYIKYNAYQYWLGSETNKKSNDECLFEGLAKVIEIIDSGGSA